MTREIDLSAGTIEYEDTGGEGPAIVLLPGLLMDASLWDEVVGGLAPDYRCIVPTLPMGAHRHPMHDDADLSPRGLARLVAELLDRLDLTDVTLVGNDTGGALEDRCTRRRGRRCPSWAARRSYEAFNLAARRSTPHSGPRACSGASGPSRGCRSGNPRQTMER